VDTWASLAEDEVQGVFCFWVSPGAPAGRRTPAGVGQFAPGGAHVPLLVSATATWARQACRISLSQLEESMKTLALKVQRFLVSEDGPTAVEYAVMLALIVIVCLTAIQAIGTNASTTFQNIADQLD
jgi:pilus assembly protein Flp/PilA